MFPTPLSPGQTVLPTQANSSQVTKSKLASASGRTVPPSRASSQENHSNCLNTTAQSHNNNKPTWRELAWVGWGRQTVKNVARVGRKFELHQIQAKSIQLKPSGWPNDTQLHRSYKLGPFGQGLKRSRVLRDRALSFANDSIRDFSNVRASSPRLATNRI